MSNTRDKAVQGQEVLLQIQYFDAAGEEVDADDYPSIQIRDLDGNVIESSSSDDVTKLDIGLYQYTYTVPSDAETGDWSDRWSAVIDNAPFQTSFTFAVIEPEDALTANTGPAKIQIADDVVFDFSDEEIYGINIMLKYLKARLRSEGRRPVRDENGAFITDGYGEFVLENCNVFDDEVLVVLLCQALSEFNSTPFFTAYTFADPVIQTLFAGTIAEGAYVFALASQALLEKGRDFTISDGGQNYQPPQLGDFLQAHYSAWLTSYRDRLKFLKNSIRPGPRGYGTYSNATSGAPAYLRLRHLRARRIV